MKNTITAILVLLLLFIIFTALTPDAGGQAEYSTHIVQPGETLWEICSKRFPDEDPRKIIYEIRRINSIDCDIQPFEEIKVPIL